MNEKWVEESINGLLNGTVPMGLPIASESRLGGIKVGSGLNITEEGTLSATAQELTPATASTLGGVKIGSGITVTSDGTISATGGSGGAHASTHATGGSDPVTPASIGAAATSHTHGAADITSGTISASRLPISGASSLGAVKVGAGLSVTQDGTLSVNGEVSDKLVSNGSATETDIVLGTLTATSTPSDTTSKSVVCPSSVIRVEETILTGVTISYTNPSFTKSSTLPSVFEASNLITQNHHPNGFRAHLKVQAYTSDPKSAKISIYRTIDDELIKEDTVSGQGSSAFEIEKDVECELPSDWDYDTDSMYVILTAYGAYGSNVECTATAQFVAGVSYQTTVYL